MTSIYESLYYSALVSYISAGMAAFKYFIDGRVGWRPPYSSKKAVYGAYPLIAVVCISLGIYLLAISYKLNENMWNLYAFFTFLIPFLLTMKQIIVDPLLGYPFTMDWKDATYGTYPIVICGFISLGLSLFSLSVYYQNEELKNP